MKALVAYFYGSGFGNAEITVSSPTVSTNQIPEIRRSLAKIHSIKPENIVIINVFEVSDGSATVRNCDRFKDEDEADFYYRKEHNSAYAPSGDFIRWLFSPKSEGAAK